jgi:predicted transcriptional regulator
MMARAVVVAVVVLGAAPALALSVGQRVSSVQVRDANNQPAWIPDIGKKVISLFYTDPDVKDQNEPFRDLLKANNLDVTRYRGIGVANLKDTWKPNFIIRKIIRGKIEKFKALILTDTDHTLKRAWSLGDCNEKDITIIIGKDQRVHFFKAGALTDAEKQRALALIKQLMTR